MAKLNDEKRTKKQLIEELVKLRRLVSRLEASKSRQSSEEELFRILRASSPIGLFIVQDGKFRFVNDEFYRSTGRSPTDLIGTETMKLVLPEDRSMVRDNAVKMLRGERTSPYKYRILNSEGNTMWRLEGVVSVQFGGRRAVLGHSVDITELERAEVKLQEAYEQERNLRKELEAEVRRRIEFTRALVHELKTPLTPVLASSELLASELKTEPWLSIAQNINRGASNLSRRIDELLDLAKVEIGTLQINMKEVDARQLLASAGDDMAALISSNGQSLKVEIPQSLPLAWADGERVQQVVLNLLINASKFTPEGGEITLRGSKKGKNLLVEVEDNGHGISEEEQVRLFQPYYRLMGDLEHLSGLGLGLALSRHLVELQGGKIWIESEVGKGSTFSFTIPLAKKNQGRDAALQQEVVNESPDN